MRLCYPRGAAAAAVDAALALFPEGATPLDPAAAPRRAAAAPWFRADPPPCHGSDDGPAGIPRCVAPPSALPAGAAVIDAASAVLPLPSPCGAADLARGCPGPKERKAAAAAPPAPAAKRGGDKGGKGV